jgi:hypothetical protein
MQMQIEACAERRSQVRAVPVHACVLTAGAGMMIGYLAAIRNLGQQAER